MNSSLKGTTEAHHMEAAWERAATHGDVEGVRELLAVGVDVNARNRYGKPR